MNVPDVNHTTPGADSDALETLCHACYLVFVIVHYTNEGIRAPQENFTVFVTSQEQMPLSLKLLVKTCKVVVFKVSNDRNTTNWFRYFSLL
jgi:hypothetical protein